VHIMFSHNDVNLCEEAINKGERLENSPAHQLIVDVRFEFRARASCSTERLRPSCNRTRPRLF